MNLFLYSIIVYRTSFELANCKKKTALIEGWVSKLHERTKLQKESLLHEGIFLQEKTVWHEDTFLRRVIFLRVTILLGLRFKKYIKILKYLFFY